MKGIIMAGGAGSRLRPLTDDMPKPMMPIINKPIIAYTVQLLKSAGIDDIAMTLGYRPEKIIDYFGSGERFGVNISYFIEKEPLGTAGGVKNAAEFIDDDFIVISGDAFTNIDVKAMTDYHFHHGDIATIAVKRVDNAYGFGVVEYDKNGKVLSFKEKPNGVTKAHVNTGIYAFKRGILDYIPSGKYDFGRELFPAILGNISAYPTDAYWSDIGTLSSYYLTNNDVATYPDRFNIVL